VQPTPSSSPSSSSDYIRREVKKVELVDLTLDIPTNVLLKDGNKPFKVVLSFNQDNATLRVHFIEIVK
jgi:hypothetical protein